MIDINELVLDLKDSFAGLGLGDFKARLNLNIDLTQQAQGEIGGKFKALLMDLETKPKENMNKVSQEIYKIISKTKEINFLGDFQNQADGLKLNFKSNLDQILENAVGDLIDSTISEAKQQMRKELDRYIGGALKDNKELNQIYTNISQMMDGKSVEISGFERIIENKKSEAQQRITALGQKAAEDITNKAAEKVDNLLDNFGF